MRKAMKKVLYTLCTGGGTLAQVAQEALLGWRCVSEVCDMSWSRIHIGLRGATVLSIWVLG